MSHKGKTPSANCTCYNVRACTCLGARGHACACACTHTHTCAVPALMRARSPVELCARACAWHSLRAYKGGQVGHNTCRQRIRLCMARHLQSHLQASRRASRQRQTQVRLLHAHGARDPHCQTLDMWPCPLTQSCMAPHKPHTLTAPWVPRSLCAYHATCPGPCSAGAQPARFRAPPVALSSMMLKKAAENCMNTH